MTLVFVNYGTDRPGESDGGRMLSFSMTSQPTIGAPYAEIGLNAIALDHPNWKRAHPIQIIRKWSGADTPAFRHAEARIIWTNDSLLVRFVCRQEEPLIVNSTPLLTEKTLRLWDGDVCEIFIAPDPKTPERYFEFEASPLGEWVDLAISLKPSGRETDFEFQSGMSAAASIDESQITIAMQMPWSSFLPKPQKGDVWRVNLFRCVGVGDDRYLAWQPTYSTEPNFHVPEVFGWLEFL